ncbi:MAG: carboxypeptidase regulatory-like domain-containing protein, partial [Syntrophothermus sp.]
MRLRGILPLILFVSSGLLFSQKNSGVFKATGMVADEITGKELVKASVAVNSRTDNKTIAGGTTDEKGNYTIDNISEKIVRIKFSMIGYQPVVIDSVDLDKTSRLGLIKLRQAAIVLPDVVIKSLKPMIEFQADRQVLNMDRLPGNTGSVTDALKNSGTVEVDPQSKKITVRGQDIKLQMDGHDYSMPSDMLSQLPASMIEQVEIILAPGAKESAEGGTYILNLVSKKNATQDNYSGSISFNTSTTNSNSGGINLNYKLGKLNLFSQMYGGYYEYSGVSSSERLNYLSRSMYQQASSDRSASYGRSGYFKLGFDYDFDDANSMTAY